MKIKTVIYQLEIHNFDVPGKIKKSVNVMHYTSTQICQYFNSNLHQFIWIQFYVSRYYRSEKLFQGEKPVFNQSKSQIFMEKLTFKSRFITRVVCIDS